LLQHSEFAALNFALSKVEYQYKDSLCRCWFQCRCKLWDLLLQFCHWWEYMGSSVWWVLPADGHTRETKACW